MPKHLSFFRFVRLSGALFVILILGSSPSLLRAQPWAAGVVSYVPGPSANPFYNNPATALGSPERFSGESTPWPSVVSMFSPAFGGDEIVSIGEGGQLTLRFDSPVSNDPGHLYGVDLIVFGNSGFVDTNYPNGQFGSPAELFGEGRASVEVSQDGINYLAVTGLADGLFPTQGYLDGGPFDGAPGTVLSNFLRPMNPALSLASFDGLSYAQALALYDGSGGGTPVDISSSGLASISYVRFSLADDGNPGTSLAAEIDAMAAVPEPMAGMALGIALAIVRNRRECSRR